MPIDQFNLRVELVSWTQFTSASTPGTYTNFIDFAGVGDGRIDCIMATNNDTVDHTISFSQTTNDTQLWGNVNVPAGSGFGAIPAVDCLAALRPSDQKFLMLPAGFQINVTFTTAITSGKIVNLNCQGGTF